MTIDSIYLYLVCFVGASKEIVNTRRDIWEIKTHVGWDISNLCPIRTLSFFVVACVDVLAIS